jgi:hypothetical protein
MIEKFLDGFGFNVAYAAVAAFIVAILALIRFEPQLAVQISTNILVPSIPIWLPPILLLIFWKLWIQYIRLLFATSQQYALLEIKLPKEIAKSPKGMELFMASIWSRSGESTFLDRSWYGKQRIFYSFEIVSTGGKIHMYIMCRKALVEITQARLYAQYPDLSISEVPDYARMFDFDHRSSKLIATEYKLRKNDVYPIRTYVDYGLDKDPKEEYKVDPLTSVFELLGEVKPNENFWIQIIFRARKSDQPAPGLWAKITSKKINQLEEDAQKTIKDILAKAKSTDATQDYNKLTKGQQFVIESIERATSKLQFEVGMRALYFAPKDTFRFSIASALFTLMNPFNTNDLNEFIPTRFHAGFDYPWQDFRDFRSIRVMYRAFNYYRLRAYFNPPYEQRPFVLNSEELATIFHFPGATLQTPTLEKIQSRRFGAPANLPM